MTNLAQIITPQILRAQFFFQKKSAETLIFTVFFDKQCFVKNKLGPDNNTSKGQTWPQIITPQHIYICCKVKKLVQDLGFYKLKTGPSYKFKTGPSFFLLFFPSFVVFLAFFETQIVSQCVKIVFLQNFGLSKMRFSKRKLHFLFFSFFMLENRNRKKKKKTKKGK